MSDWMLWYLIIGIVVAAIASISNDEPVTMKFLAAVWLTIFIWPIGLSWVGLKKLERRRMAQKGKE
jgi:hypothetical protein